MHERATLFHNNQILTNYMSDNSIFKIYYILSYMWCISTYAFWRDIIQTITPNIRLNTMGRPENHSTYQCDRRNDYNRDVSFTKGKSVTARTDSRKSFYRNGLPIPMEIKRSWYHKNQAGASKHQKQCKYNYSTKLPTSEW